jgi:hypothetical protein
LKNGRSEPDVDYALRNSRVVSGASFEMTLSQRDRGGNGNGRGHAALDALRRRTAENGAGR